MNYKYLVAGAAFAVFGAATSASAAPCATSAVTIDLFGDATSCAGAIEGNDTGSSTFLADLNAGSIFAGFGFANLGSMWTLFGKSDDGLPTVTADNGATFGNWAATGVAVNTVVTLKAGDCFSAFLFSPLASTSVSGTFSMGGTGITVGGPGAVGCDGKNVPELSHLSVFTNGGTPEIVPLPAAGLLLIGGIGGLAALRSRKTT